MYPPVDPVQSMLEDHPELSAGPHMVHIGQGLVDLGKTRPRSARRLAAAIMRASPTKNTPISSAMESLLQLDDGATDGEFLAVVKEYDTKPLDDEGTVPDDFDFLQPGKALGAFVQSAVGRIRAPKGLDDVADELANMSARERNILVENVVSGKEGWKYDMASLPVGCELN